MFPDAAVNWCVSPISIFTPGGVTCREFGEETISARPESRNERRAYACQSYWFSRHPLVVQRGVVESCDFQRGEGTAVIISHCTLSLTGCRGIVRG